MTSWAAANPVPRPPIRQGYYQAAPLGTFQPDDGLAATVVTAYYEMKSKYDPEKYRDWIRRFLRTLTCPIVFFTDAAGLPFLESCPKASSQVRFVVLPRSEWKANDPGRFPTGTWEKQWGLDPEKAIHSPDLYKVWYEKKEFVLRAAELNPFGSSKFVWTDAGILRDPAFEEILKLRYPVASRIPNDRMMLLNHTPFTKSDDVEIEVNGVKIRGGGKDKPRLGGGVLAGTAAIWRKWSELYDEVVRRLLRAGLFIGKDQTIFITITMENKGFISLVDGKKIAPGPWQQFLLYLGVKDSVLAILKSPRADRETWSYVRFIEQGI